MNWNNLTMKQRSNLMKLYLKHGITSLDAMREHYNQYAEGGPIKTKTSNYSVGRLVDALYKGVQKEEYLGEPWHHYDFAQSSEWADAHGYYPDVRGHRDDRVKKSTHPSHPSRGTFYDDGRRFELSDKGIQNVNHTLFGLNDGGQDPQAVLTHKGAIVLPEITVTPNGNYIHNTYDNIKMYYDEGGHLYSGVDTETEWDPETFGLTNYRAISKPNKKQDLTINQEQRDRAMQVLQEERAKSEAGGYKANIVKAAEEAAAKGWAEDEIDFQNYMYHTLSQWGGNEEAPSSTDPLDNLSPKEREYLAHIQAGLKMIADYILSHNGVDNRPDNPRYTVGNLPSREEEKQWIEWCNRKGINPYEPITEYIEAANKAREIQSIQKQIDEAQKNSFKSWWNPGLTDLAIDVTGLGGGVAQFYSKTANAGKIISAGTDAVDYGTSGYNAATGQLSEGDIGNAIQLTGYGGAAASGIKSIKPWIYDAARAAKAIKYVGPFGNAISIPFDIVETIRLQEEHTQERERELKGLERLREKKQELLNDSYDNIK